MPLGANKAAIMGVAGVSAGADLVLLSSQTFSDSAGVAFTSGIDSTYGEYIFGFYNIKLETDDYQLAFQVNASGESGYNETITSTFFKAFHSEGDSTSFAYGTGSGDPSVQSDQAQGTAYQPLIEASGSAADENSAGKLHLFNPSSTTYVKHFCSRLSSSEEGEGELDNFAAGYINTTAAITGINFKSTSGAIDGTIKMWGVK